MQEQRRHRLGVVFLVRQVVDVKRRQPSAPFNAEADIQQAQRIPRKGILRSPELIAAQFVIRPGEEGRPSRNGEAELGAGVEGAVGDVGQIVADGLWPLLIGRDLAVRVTVGGIDVQILGDLPGRLHLKAA